ncbi:D-cysteine desulfhydrase family protein [Pelomyxa schiedti]|nr:D-cysteine desulfhydrase family protein [Pelomyxa schiedti]
MPRDSIPTSRVRVAMLPTRITPSPIILPGAQPTPTKGAAATTASGTSTAPVVYVKRDDETGLYTTGNKVRKLEFFLADALAKGCDCIVTSGGLQSNHCRATSAASREVGLDSHLVLRVKDPAAVENKMGGNLLVSQFMGSDVTMISVEQYNAAGSTFAPFLERVAEKLRSEGRKPYVIPMGGSTSLGAWGYIEASCEIANQIDHMNLQIDDIVVSCGSSGTVAGLGVGMKLCKPGIKIHGICACDNAAFFHREINEILQGLHVGWRSEDLVTLHDGYQGIGYGESTPEELQFIVDIARLNGFILDTAYTGKALLSVTKDPAFQGRRVLFIHTGGLPGMYEKAALLEPHMHTKWTTFS